MSLVGDITQFGKNGHLALDILRVICIMEWTVIIVQALRIVTLHRGHIGIKRYIGWLSVGGMGIYVYETELDRFGHTLGVGGRLILGIVFGAGYIYAATGV